MCYNFLKLKFNKTLIYLRFLFSLFIFLFVSQLLTVFTIFFIFINKNSMRAFRSLVLMWFARFVNAINFNLKIEKRNEYNERFYVPSVIISNHVSVVDISLILSLCSKMVILTNSSLMKSRFIGLLEQYAILFEMPEDLDEGLYELKQMQSQGYSILVFPEGKKSANKIQRFHKGAFLLAEKLEMDILPLLIEAEGEFIDRNSFFKHTGMIRLKVLRRIKPDNKDFGMNYSERAKKICQYYRGLKCDNMKRVNG